MPELVWLGQKIDYDEKTNLVKTTIRSPFWKASEMLGWAGKSAGLGFNTKIIDFIQSRQADLAVFVESEKSWWYIEFMILNDFIKHNRTVYHVKNGKHKVQVIAWDNFRYCEAP